MTIDNIHRDIVIAIRDLTSAPTVEIKVVLSSDPYTAEAEFTGFELTNVTYDSLQVQGDLTIESFMNEPFPGDSFLPSTFPGLF